MVFSRRTTCRRAGGGGRGGGRGRGEGDREGGRAEAGGREGAGRGGGARGAGCHTRTSARLGEARVLVLDSVGLVDDDVAPVELAPMVLLLRSGVGGGRGEGGRVRVVEACRPGARRERFPPHEGPPPTLPPPPPPAHPPTHPPTLMTISYEVMTTSNLPGTTIWALRLSRSSRGPMNFTARMEGHQRLNSLSQLPMVDLGTIT